MYTHRTCVHRHHTCVHTHTNSLAEAHVRLRLTWPSCPEPRGSVITHTPQCRQPPARLHSALLVLTQADTPVAHGASRGRRGKPTATVVAANWLSVEPRVTARSAMADTPSSRLSQERRCCPLCLGLRQPLNRTCPATWDQPGQRALLMVAPTPRAPGRVQRWLSAQDWPGGMWCDDKVVRKAPSPNICEG